MNRSPHANVSDFNVILGNCDLLDMRFHIMFGYELGKCGVHILLS